MSKIPYHPLAETFPRIPESDFKSLVLSIGEFGLRQKIVLFEGKILDGRHRYEACIAAGVKPKFEQYEGKHPIGYVIAANLNRRHLDVSQRAMIAARLETTTWGAPKPTKSSKTPDFPEDANLQITRSDAAELMNVSPRSIANASKVLDQAPPEVIAKVDHGEISLNAAVKAVEEKKVQEQVEEEEVVDATGWPVPDALKEVWQRRGEILDLMKKVASIKNLIENRTEDKDPLFLRIHSQDVVIKLMDAHRILKTSQLHAVCPTCMGRNMKACTLCKGSGLLTKFLWDTGIPEETKRLRERSIQLSKGKK